MRWFYTDELAAAWMAKHHGLQFAAVNENTGDGWPDISWERILLEYEGHTHYHLYGESGQLLEPRKHDLCELTGHDYRRIVRITPEQIDVHNGWFSREEWDGRFVRIAERAGVTFFWPERAGE